MRLLCHSHRNLGPRAAFAAVAIASVAGQVAGIAHQALVRHERCAVHGDLVHPGEGGHEYRIARHGANDELGPQPVETHSGAHEHCLVPAHLRTPVTLSTPVAVVLARPPLPASVDPVDSSRPAAIALFRLAPKNSPPAS
jgi:hypothetical protein